MTPDDLRDLLEQVAGGAITAEAAMQRLRYQPIDDLGFARVDTHRALRTGMPEVIYGAGKTPAQIAAIAASIAGHAQPVLVTKTEAAAFEAVRAELPDAVFHSDARMITHVPESRPEPSGRVLVLTGGTSDAAVAAEAHVTAQALGATRPPSATWAWRDCIDCSPSGSTWTQPTPSWRWRAWRAPCPASSAA